MVVAMGSPETTPLVVGGIVKVSWYISIASRASSSSVRFRAKAIDKSGPENTKVMLTEGPEAVMSS